MIHYESLQDEKSIVKELNESFGAEKYEVLARKIYSDDTKYYCTDPINQIDGFDSYINKFYNPLKHAMPEVEKRPDMFMSGTFHKERQNGNDTQWVSQHGYYYGTFEKDFLTIPATRTYASIRYAEHSRFENGRIVESYCFLDMVDFIQREAGITILPPSKGRDGMTPAPADQSGLMYGPQPHEAAVSAMDAVEGMIYGLSRFNDGGAENGPKDAEEGRKAMGMEQFWSKNMMWYGPGGTGTTRGIEGFQRYHQMPFLAAFPDRVGGRNHKARIAEGHYVCSIGWPSVVATHTGGDYYGFGPSGKRIGMRVTDFWREQNGLLVENWVMIDMLDLIKQFGVDLIARMHTVLNAK